MIKEIAAGARRKGETYTICVGDERGTIAFTSQVEIVCIPPHQLAPGETQAKIVVKSLTEAVTGVEVLDVFNSHSPRTEVDAAGRVPSPTTYDGRRRATRCLRQGGWECNGKYMC